jgi:hypothetical protein
MKKNGTLSFFGFLIFALINFMVKPHGLLVLVSSIRHRTYTSSLSTL